MNQKQIVILDGGTGVSLAEMGHSFIDGDPLWSAAIVSTCPEDLIKLHKEFLLAGSDVVVTATYQASVEGYKKRFGVTDDVAIDLIKHGVQLAKTARDEAEKVTGRHGYVAASVGPYGATLCDFSEFHGKYADTMTKEELSSWHLPRLKALVESKPDLLAIETIPVIKEAEAVLECLKQFPDVKAWVTFQCKSGNQTGHGDDIQDAVKTVLKYDNVVAVGVNCTHPDYVSELLQNITEVVQSKISVIVKPNGGLFDPEKKSAIKCNLSSRVKEWLEAGANWIGGCCHINPSDIAEIRKTVEGISDAELMKTGDKFV